MLSDDSRPEAPRLKEAGATALEIHLENPFPGLRTFTSEESHLFFGREGQSDELLRKMDRRRFVAVLGVSGSGKSSLVHAGLLPSLYNGYLARAGSEWHVADFRPGGDPIGNLAAALSGTALWGGGLDASVLRTSSLALVSAARQARESRRWREGENLLILADQFEELFRFRVRQESAMADRDEKASFVKLLLEAAQQRDLPIYVVVTMRSDFLGDCAQFRDLPEAINEGQYLIPRMTREQRSSAIEAPIQVVGGVITPRLVQRILNDAGEDPGRLPVMQHALMRTWYHWRDRGQADEPIDIEDYEAIGTMTQALSSHADEAYLEACQKLPGQAEEVVKRIFQRLRERDLNGREIRRPTSLAELSAVAETSHHQTLTALECFRRERRTFLMPPPEIVLRDNTQIDITHECLLRQWKRLTTWVAQEQESRRIYGRLAERAEEQETSDTPDYLKGARLQLALDWWERRRPNRTWAERYHPGFDAANKFLLASKRNRERERQREEDAHRQEEERRVEEAQREQQARENQLRAEAQIKERELKKRWAYVLAGLLFGAALITGLSWWNAVQQARIARTRQLAAEANDNLASDANLSVWLALQAVSLQKPVLPQAEQALQRAILSSRFSLALEGHQGEVLSVAFSRDGSRLLTAERNGVAIVWDLVGGQQLTSIPHGEQIRGAAFSSDGAQVFTFGETGFKTWDAASPERPIFYGPQKGLVALALSPDGRWLATAGTGKTVAISETANPKKIRELPGHTGTVRAVAFSSDGRRLVSGGDDMTARVWDADTGDLLATLGPHRDQVLAVAFSPDGKFLVTGYRDWIAKVWNLSTGQEVGVLRGHTDDVVGVAFSPDGTRMATASQDSTVKIWSVATLQELSQLRGHSKPLTGVAFHPGGARLATASEDRTARVWNLVSEQELLTLPGYRVPVNGAAFSRDSRQLVTGESGGLVKIWDVASGWERATLNQEGQSVIAVAFSPDGKRVASLGVDPRAAVFRFSKTLAELARLGVSCSSKVWDVATGKELTSGPGSHTGNIAFSPDGDLVAVGGKEGPQVYHADSGQALSINWEDKNPIRSVVFAPSGKLLAAGGEDGKTRMFNVDSGRLQWRAEPSSLSSIYGLAFSHDGQHLATAHQNGSVIVMDSHTGNILRSLEAHSGWVFGAAFSPDGQRLATAALDKTVKLWDVNGVELMTLAAHSDRVYGVAFSPDGQWMATAGGDGDVQLYPANVPLLLAVGRSRLHRAPTQSECAKYFDPSKCSKMGETLRELLNGNQMARGGKIEAAVAHFRKAQALDRGLQLDPATEARALAVASLAAQGRNLARVGEVERAAELLGRAQQLDPRIDLEPKSAATRLAVDELVAQGRSRARAGDVEGAVDRFERARSLDPSPGQDPKDEAYKLLAEQAKALAAAGNADDAADLFRKAKDVDPRYSHVVHEARKATELAFVSRGSSRAAAGDYDGALAAYQKAKALDQTGKLDPREEAGRRVASYWISKARSEAKAQNTQTALADYQRALELDPKLNLDPKVEVKRLAAMGDCYDLVQGKIDWDYQGSKTWADRNVDRLCHGSSTPTEPPKCFERVMHGGIDWGGGARWTWLNALELCAGTNDADRAIACFQTKVRQGDTLSRAIQACGQSTVIKETE